jgi:undecaprenol kinase
LNSRKNLSLLQRFGFALTGLLHGVRAEHSFRLEVILFALVMVALTVLRPGPLWWAAVMLASAGVLAAELLNTAIETLADHLNPEFHPRIRIVKDCAAAAVLVTVVAAIAVAVALAVHLSRR